MRAISVIAVLFAAVLVAGCATQPKLSKVGVSAKQQQKDSKACWKIASTAEKPTEGKVAGVVANLVLGGPVQLVGHLIAESIDDSNPKNGYRKQVHTGCMKKKGYRVSG